MISNFLFHRVNPVRDRLWDPMDVRHFDKTIKYISNNYNVNLIEDLLFSDLLTSKRERFATIMFDDGYKDNIEFASNILDKYNCKASFYIVTQCIDKNIPTWTYQLDYLVKNSKAGHIKLDFHFIPSELRNRSFKNSGDRLRYVGKLKPFLKNLSHKERDVVLNIVKNVFNDVALPAIMMNWNDLRELHASGHYIGSHTVTHCMLGTMSDESEIIAELTNSSNRIKENIGYFPISLSYPVGSFNEETKKLTKSAGYKIGLAVKQNIYNPLIDDLYEIPRIELYNESWFKTRLRISNKLETFKKYIKYI